MDIGQHAVPLDEVRDPGRAFAKVDRDLAVRAESQELALDRTGRPGRTFHRGGYSLHWQPVGSMPPSPPPEHVALEVPSLNAVVAGATTAVAERRVRVAGRNCGSECFDRRIASSRARSDEFVPIDSTGAIAAGDAASAASVR